jgi:hypothetical protein
VRWGGVWGEVASALEDADGVVEVLDPVVDLGHPSLEVGWGGHRRLDGRICRVTRRRAA